MTNSFSLAPLVPLELIAGLAALFVAASHEYAGGIVYHANHIRYMERTRTEWLRAAGVDHYWHQEDYNFVVHQIQVKYVRPILMDDLITVTARVILCKAASFVLQQNIYRGEILLASGEVTLACLNKDMMPRRLPDEIRDLIQKELAQD